MATYENPGRLVTEACEKIKVKQYNWIDYEDEVSCKEPFET